MRAVLAAGTDVATVSLGDPSCLEVLSRCKGVGPCEREAEAAVARGDLWRWQTGGDGAYLLHLFVDEAPPAHLLRFFDPPQRMELFHVPSGRLRFAGEEAFIGALDISKYPHMGAETDVPPGDYSLVSNELDWPDEWFDEQFAAASTPEQRLWRERGDKAMGHIVLSVVAALVLAYFTYLKTVSLLFALLPAVLPILAWQRLNRIHDQPAFKSAKIIADAIDREMPSVVITLTSIQRESTPTSSTPPASEQSG